MKFLEICTVTALMVLSICNSARAGLTGLNCSRSDPPYTTATDITLMEADTVGSAPALPEMASDPIPSNGAVNVSVEADLGWTPGICLDDRFSQSIYMSTDPDGLWSAFIGTTDLDFFDPGTLQNNTTYYWRIDTACTDMVFIGDTWEFTTEVPEPAALVLLGLGASVLRKRGQA